MRKMFARGYAALPILLATAVVVTTGAIAASLTTGSDQLMLQERQENASGRAEQALMGFVLANHRLPCPDTDDDGLENCPAADSTEPQRAGKVPYRSIGISGRQVLSLAYVPMMHYEDPDQPDIDHDLTDSSNPRGDVVRIELPDGVPQVDLDVVDPSYSQPSTSTEPDEARDMLEALQQYDNFWSDLLINDAEPSPYSLLPNRPVSTRLDSDGGSWIDYYERLLLPENQFDINDGDPDNIQFNDDTTDNSTLYEETQEFLYWLKMRRVITEAKAATFDDIIDIQIIQSDIVDVITDPDLTDEEKVSGIGEIRDGSGDYDYGWLELIDDHNTAVGEYNGSNDFSDSSTNVSVSTTDLTVLDYDDLNYCANTTPTPDFCIDDPDELPALIEAMNAVINETASDIQSNADALGQALADASDYMETESSNLITAYGNAEDDAQGQIDSYTLEINSAPCVQDPLADDCADAQTYLDQYEVAHDFYADLQVRTEWLRDDFFCRATSDNECTTDDVQQEYLDRINELQDDLTGPDGVVDQEAEDAIPELDDDDPTEPAPGTPGAEILGDVPLPTRTRVPFTYPEYSNLADICHKLQGIRSSAGGDATIRYPDTPVNGVPAFLLIEYGRNLRLDTPNQLEENAGMFASPTRAHDPDYDDRVRPMTAESMSIALGCDALLQSYASFANVAEEIDLLYRVAADNVDGAVQDIITNSINSALGVARVAVDSAAIIKDSAAGVAATSACVASLGLATNFCIAAGFNFSAAVAHAATLVGDAAALAASIAELGVAIEGRVAAQGTLTDTLNHYGDVLTEALLADCRGGVLEAGSVGLGSSECDATLPSPGLNLQ